MTPAPEPADPEATGRGPAEELEDLDPGLARYRTDLAWTRTAISFAALGAAIIKESPPAGGVVLAGSAFIWCTGWVTGSPGRAGRAARVAGRAAGRAADDERRLLLVAIAVTAVAIAALVLALVAGGPVRLR